MAGAGMHDDGFFGIRLVLSLNQPRRLRLLAYVMAMVPSFPSLLAHRLRWARPARR
jgi:hypothetical protein